MDHSVDVWMHLSGVKQGGPDSAAYNRQPKSCGSLMFVYLQKDVKQFCSDGLNNEYIKI